MRVLHVTDTFLPRLGGIELHVADLAARQRALGDDVLVLTAEHGTFPPDLRGADDVAVRRVGRLLHRRSDVARAVAEHDPDVVHAHLSVASPFAWAVLREARTQACVASLHSLLPASPTLVRAGLAVSGLPVGRLLFTAVSEVAAARLRPALPATQAVHVLHNGVDPAAWAVPHEPTGHFHVLVVGRLAARKRPLVAVDALARMHAAAPDLDWRATFVGDGPQRVTLVGALRARGLEARVRVLGPLSREEVRARLGTADVLLAPALLESFGLAALEARCAGVPIVGMAASGLTEFVRHEVDGLLAVDVQDVARSLLRLAREPGLAARIRRHSTSEPVPMTWGEVLRDHRAAYALAQELAGRPGAAPVVG